MARALMRCAATLGDVGLNNEPERVETSLDSARTSACANIGFLGQCLFKIGEDVVKALIPAHKHQAVADSHALTLLGRNVAMRAMAG